VNVARRCRDWLGLRPRLLIYDVVSSKRASAHWPAGRRWFRGQLCARRRRRAPDAARAGVGDAAWAELAGSPVYVAEGTAASERAVVVSHHRRPRGVRVLVGNTIMCCIWISTRPSASRRSRCGCTGPTKGGLLLPNPAGRPSTSSIGPDGAAW